MSVLVKICGITNVEDAEAAVQAGADALGFVFFPRSPRFVKIDTAAYIARNIPSHIWRVGVFINPSEDLLTDAIDACGLTVIQLHGDETPEVCSQVLQLGVQVMKAFRVKDISVMKEVERYRADYVLLDTYMEHAYGGTGAAFNWEIGREIVAKGMKVFLAGGLTPENVANAVRIVRPFGVDVSSGVEHSPGRKDPARLRAFIRAAKSVDLQKI